MTEKKFKTQSVFWLWAFVTLSALASVSFIGTPTAPAQATNRPNIIFILTDDQRWNALGYAGNRYIHTPEMDKLAAAGVYFEHAMATTPICSASRASLLSGLRERTHKYTFQTGPVPEDYMRYAYPRILKEDGYYTGFYGKLGVKYDHNDRLFDVVDDYDRNNKFNDRRGYFYKTIDGDTVHLTQYTGSQALNFIRLAPKDRPFCLSLSFSAPHAHDSAPDQYFWEPTMEKLYEGVTFPGPDLGDDTYFNALPEAVRKGENRTRWHWRFDTPEKYQRSIRGYYRMISGVDAQIAAIRQELKKQKLDQNTVIVLMADNGYFLGDRQLADKWLMYETSLRVPLIIYDPRQKQHRRIQDIALNIDIPATLLDYAGVKQPTSWHGRSLKPLVSGNEKTLRRDTLLFEHLWETPIIPPSEGIRTSWRSVARWKYFRYVNNKADEELYDLQKDPQEITNLAQNPAYQKILLTLRNQCDQQINRYKDADWDVVNPLPVRRQKEVQFGWTFSPRITEQKAYQILVSSDLDKLDKNMADVWDSGRIVGKQQSEVAYKGAALQSGHTYYWKVRVYDQDNRLTEYSKTASFMAPNGTNGK